MDAVELTVSRVLTVGIAFSILLMAAGLLLGVITGSGMPRGVVPLAELLSGLVALDPAAYLSVGLIALIATPFVRVAGSIVAFAREGDRRYVVITSTVLVVMCLSVLLGKV
jgi:uncharacterized membrane protein